MGFIAQEAADVIPEVVSVRDDRYSMQYAPVTALLVEAIKEQQKLIANQQKQIESAAEENILLKSQLRYLREKVDQIEVTLSKAGVK